MPEESMDHSLEYQPPVGRLRWRWLAFLAVVWSLYPLLILG
jgi:hypothetical protein